MPYGAIRSGDCKLIEFYNDNRIELYDLMGRLFQAASTVDGVLRGDTIERAAEAGLRSLFVGFETLDPAVLRNANKVQNLGRDYDRAIRRLDNAG
jgi:hypothetical protein